MGDKTTGLVQGTLDMLILKTLALAVFDFLADKGYGIFLLNDFLKQRAALNRDSFERQFNERTNERMIRVPTTIGNPVSPTRSSYSPI